MTNTFQIVVIGVAAVGLVLSFTRYLWPFSVIRETGRVGSFFEHTEDRPIDEHPDSSDNDPPIPRRRLRARP